MKLISAEKRIKQINEINDIEFLSWTESYINSKSRVRLRCLRDGFEWETNVNNILNRGTGCPQCSGKRRWTAEERIEQINNIENIEFVSWLDGYVGSTSKVKVRCSLDGFEWDCILGNIVYGGTGCPQCSGKRTWNADERIEQINSIDGIKFNSWYRGEYKNKNSKAFVFCEYGHSWSASVSNLLAGTGCPHCAKYGFQLDKKGYLYALRSECGQYVKVGISNKPKRRHKDLERETPFKFNIIEQISGDGGIIAGMEKHFHSKYESACFSGFDGATEWLVCTDDLLKELIEVAQ